MVSVMVGSGFVGFIFRGMRIYFSQDHMYRVLKNFRECRSVSAKECRNILLLRSCVVSRLKVCEILATFWVSADLKASLICESFSAWSGKECRQERCEVELVGPDWMRWAGLGQVGFAFGQ